MSRTNTYKDHLQYSEKERNVKNFVFDTHHYFDLCQSFMDSRNATHSTHAIFL